jgi:Flp pilus assembly protein TadG
MLQRRSLRRHLKTGGSRGQALVEFSLVILTFMTLVVAIAEFAFFLTAKAGVTSAAQDSVQLASELGNTPNADFYILQEVDNDMAPPISAPRPGPR